MLFVFFVLEAASVQLRKLRFRKRAGGIERGGGGGEGEEGMRLPGKLGLAKNQ